MAFGISMDADGVPTLFSRSETAAMHQWPLITTNHNWASVDRGTPLVVTHVRARKNQPRQFHIRADGLVDAVFVGMVTRREGGRGIQRPLLRSTLDSGKTQTAEACYFAFQNDTPSVARLVQFLAQRRAERQMAHLFCTYADGRKKELALASDSQADDLNGDNEHTVTRSRCNDRGDQNKRGETMQSVAIQTLSDFVGEDGRYSVHPAADLFPLIEGQEFDRLVDSIREHGIQNPVVLNRDADGNAVLLDGRNRLRAAERLKEQGITVNVPVTTFPYMDGITEVEWIEAQNIDRRHLTEDARAMLAASLHELIEADAAKAKKDSQFNADTAKAAAAKRHGKTATTDSASPQKRDRKRSEARTTAAKVASNGKVSRHKAKQAIAAAKAIKAGTVSPDVRKDVIAGKKKLKDAVPTKATPDKSKRRYQSIDDEIQFEINRAWSRLRGKFAPGVEHKKLREAMIALIRKEQKTFEK